jgi:hypothetical protein
VYVVVCVGLSASVPAARVLLITVREVEPEEAVMVTLVEFVAFHLSVTLCPEGIVLVFAEKIKIGVPELFSEVLPPAPPHAPRPKRTQSKLTKPILRTNFSFILPRPCFASGVQMPRC